MADFGKFLNAAKSVMQSVASIENKLNKIDRNEKGENREGAIAKEMLKGINNAAAQTVGLDTVNFEATKNSYKTFLGNAKSELTPFVNDAEILADLMGALAEIEPNLDMTKVEKYNKKHPVLATGNVAETITTSTVDGYVGVDAVSFNTISEALGEDAGKVFSYMSDAIKSGSASRIMNNQRNYEKDVRAAENILRATKDLAVNDDIIGIDDADTPL